MRLIITAGKLNIRSTPTIATIGNIMGQAKRGETYQSPIDEPIRVVDGYEWRKIYLQEGNGANPAWIATNGNGRLFASVFGFHAWPTDTPIILPHPIPNDSNYIYIASTHGGPIRAVCSGKIVTTGHDNRGAVVTLEGIDGFRVIYDHLNDISVKQGDLVVSRDVVGHATTHPAGTHTNIQLAVWRRDKHYDAARLLDDLTMDAML